ncbi:transposase [Streptomyces sp. NPDC127051]|uniref:transposase n=1 Tax=Streptomyces sp. NPDC127051 TaxID=3347119 RepID=UPI003657B556
MKADPAKVARRTACGVPDDIGYVEKWQLALDMLDETRSWGVEVPVAVADAGCGDVAAFRHGLQAPRPGVRRGHLHHPVGPARRSRAGGRALQRDRTPGRWRSTPTSRSLRMTVRAAQAGWLPLQTDPHQPAAQGR